MSWFKRIKAKRCLGDVDNTCPKFLSGEEQNLALTNCDCGSSLKAIEETNKSVVALAAVIGVAILGGSALAILPSNKGDSSETTTQKTSPVSSSSPFASSTPTPSNALTTTPTPTPTTPTSTPSPSATVGPRPTESSAPSPTPTPTTVSPKVDSPPPPTEQQIKVATQKLGKMNPDCLIEFPVDGDSTYSLIGFQAADGGYDALTTAQVRRFVEEGISKRGKFSDSDTIALVVRQTGSKDRLVLPPVNRSHLFGQLVRSLNVMNSEVCFL
jgi:hypothetical protein